MCCDAFSDLLTPRTLVRDPDNLDLTRWKRPIGVLLCTMVGINRLLEPVLPWGSVLPALAHVLLQLDHQ